MADLVRDGVDALLESPEKRRPGTRQGQGACGGGRFRSGVRDLATKHDDHLADTWAR